MEDVKKWGWLVAALLGMVTLVLLISLGLAAFLSLSGGAIYGTSDFGNALGTATFVGLIIAFIIGAGMTCIFVENL